MKVRYHYSMIANVLFLALGLVFLVVSLDLLFFHALIRAADAPPTFVALVILFLGVLTTSGFFMNLAKGKNYVIEADDEGITVYTQSVNGTLPQISIAWKDVRTLEVRAVRSAFHANRNDHLTRAIVIRVRPGLIEWPPVMISKNRVRYQKHDDADELIIDAWLHKKKSTIIRELKHTARSANPDIA